MSKIDPIDLAHAPPLATIPEVQATLRASRATVNRMMADGRLVAVKMGGATRITTASVKALLAALPAAQFRSGATPPREECTQ